MITLKQKVSEREIKLRPSDCWNSPILVLPCSLQSHPLKHAPVNFTQLREGERLGQKIRMVALKVYDSMLLPGPFDFSLSLPTRKDASSDLSLEGD